MLHGQEDPSLYLRGPPEPTKKLFLDLLVVGPYQRLLSPIAPLRNKIKQNTAKLTNHSTTPLQVPQEKQITL